MSGHPDLCRAGPTWLHWLIGACIFLVALGTGILIERSSKPAPAPVAAPDCVQIEGLDFRVCPTSWWRSQHHNDEVGGAAHSNHLLGCALDFVTDPPGHIPAFHEWATRHLPLTWIEPLSQSDTHVHVDWRCQERAP